MGRTLDEVMAGLPAERRVAVEARMEELPQEVDGLRALRALADRSQEQIADALGIKQPSVHKIERQADLYLSTLRSRSIHRRNRRKTRRRRISGHRRNPTRTIHTPTGLSSY